MAKFVYRMQNILDLKEKLESQEKIAYSMANARLLEEQEKLTELLVRQKKYEDHLKELGQGKLNLKEIQATRQAINSMKSLVRDQMMRVHTASRNLELARKRLEEVRKDRKTHENLKEKAFEEFKQELSAEERKATDELVSFTHNKTDEDVE